MIKITNLTKIFSQHSNRFHALHNINLDISKGDFVLLQGESGSGKSTLLSIISSLMKPTSGAVYIDNENIVSFSDIHSSEYRRDRVGFITQSFHLFDQLTLKENLLAPLVIQNISFLEMEKRIETALEMAKISHKAQQVVNTLSGGEKQRTVIARAIINKPDILICDEPTANLDEQNSQEFIKILKKLKNNGHTIIVATHDKLFNELDCIDKRFTLEKGEIIEYTLG